MGEEESRFFYQAGNEVGGKLHFEWEISDQDPQKKLKTIKKYVLYHFCPLGRIVT